VHNFRDNVSETCGKPLSPPSLVLLPPPLCVKITFFLSFVLWIRSIGAAEAIGCAYPAAGALWRAERRFSKGEALSGPEKKKAPEGA
jgi:hypothetical protein